MSIVCPCQVATSALYRTCCNAMSSCRTQNSLGPVLLFLHIHGTAPYLLDIQDPDRQGLFVVHPPHLHQYTRMFYPPHCESYVEFKQRFSNDASAGDRNAGAGAGFVVGCTGNKAGVNPQMSGRQGTAPNGWPPFKNVLMNKFFFFLGKFARSCRLSRMPEWLARGPTGEGITEESLVRTQRSGQAPRGVVGTVANGYPTGQGFRVFKPSEARSVIHARRQF